MLDMSEEHLAALREEAAMVSQETLMRYIRIFSELGNQIKFASQKRILLEIAIIKLCKPQMEQDYGSILDRLESLEKRMENGIPIATAQVGTAGGIAPAAPAFADPGQSAASGR